IELEAESLLDPEPPSAPELHPTLRAPVARGRRVTASALSDLDQVGASVSLGSQRRRERRAHWRLDGLSGIGLWCASRQRPAYRGEGAQIRDDGARVLVRHDAVVMR